MHNTVHYCQLKPDFTNVMGVLENFGTDSIQELIVALINYRLGKTSHMRPELDLGTKSFNQQRQNRGKNDSW